MSPAPQSSNSPHDNPSKLWLLFVVGFLAVVAYLGFSIAGRHYGIGPLAPTATPTPTITPTPENTPTAVPTRSPQPEIASKIEAASGGVFDVTAIAVDADSIFIVIIPNGPLPDTFDTEAFDAAISELIQIYSTGTQTSLVAMFVGIDYSSGKPAILWVNTCPINDILEFGAIAASSCSGSAVSVIIEDPATLVWLNS